MVIVMTRTGMVTPSEMAKVWSGSGEVDSIVTGVVVVKFMFPLL